VCVIPLVQVRLRWRPFSDFTAAFLRLNDRDSPLTLELSSTDQFGHRGVGLCVCSSKRRNLSPFTNVEFDQFILEKCDNDMIVGHSEFSQMYCVSVVDVLGDLMRHSIIR
jgi:hypothetical protein